MSYPTSQTEPPYSTHEAVSPQVTGASPQVGTVSPQLTGITSPHPTHDPLTTAAPRETIQTMNSGIQVAPSPPGYEASPGAAFNEKSAGYPGHEQYNGQQPQGYAQQHPPQGNYAPEVLSKGPQPNAAPRNNYQIATPLASLQQGPAPIDCPVCGVREMTRTEFVSGVFPLPSAASASAWAAFLTLLPGSKIASISVVTVVPSSLSGIGADAPRSWLTDDH
ncbi:hypothetical protein LSUE1_G001688 [Lachnellula suecica]|uniref:LITAF domain-containing protein n=1 Tax=Lachnellula suecica TaxID=602035 RepID=A0A8T9CDE3_9HELO|nr:hypothetical protein LSUE1_G001688 [Lachnellula suecica]